MPIRVYILCTYSVITQSPDTNWCTFLRNYLYKYLKILRVNDGNCLINSDTGIFAIINQSPLFIKVLPLISIFMCEVFKDLEGPGW